MADFGKQAWNARQPAFLFAKDGFKHAPLESRNLFLRGM